MDKMIAMVEGASRKKTPNELALQIFLVALSIIFVLVTMSLYAYSVFSSVEAGAANPTSITQSGSAFNSVWRPLPLALCCLPSVSRE